MSPAPIDPSMAAAEMAATATSRRGDAMIGRAVEAGSLPTAGILVLGYMLSQQVSDLGTHLQDRMARVEQSVAVLSVKFETLEGHESRLRALEMERTTEPIKPRGR